MSFFSPFLQKNWQLKDHSIIGIYNTWFCPLFSGTGWQYTLSLLVFACIYFREPKEILFREYLFSRMTRFWTFREYNIAFSAAVRGFYVYKSIWKPEEGEKLMCYYEDGNPYMFSIKVCHCNRHCNGCREKTLFLTAFSWFWVFKVSQSFCPSPLHQIFHWNIRNMTEELHSIKNCIKWKHEPNYDRELSKCNFLQSQTSTPVKRFCKSGWHKLHQQHMSALNTNRNIQTVLLGDSIIQGLSRYKKVWNSFFGKDTLNCGIRGDKVENLLWRAEKLEFLPAIRQIVIHCGTNNIEENTPNDIANGLLCSALTIKQRNSVTNVYIHHRTSTPWLQRNQHEK